MEALAHVTRKRVSVAKLPAHAPPPVARRVPLPSLASPLIRSHAPFPQKPLFTPTSWVAALRRESAARSLDRRQIAAFSALFAWRDATGRQGDDSLGYIMPRAVLLALAKAVPTDGEDGRSGRGVWTHACAVAVAVRNPQFFNCASCCMK